MAEHTIDQYKRIKALISQGETSEVEFKSARGGFPGSFGRATRLLPIQMVVRLYWVWWKKQPIFL